MEDKYDNYERGKNILMERDRKEHILPPRKW